MSAREEPKAIGMNKIEHFVFCYAGIVPFFAFINQCIFRKDSTVFVISEQLNKHVERYDFLEPEIDLVKFQENAKDKDGINTFKLINVSNFIK